MLGSFWQLLCGKAHELDMCLGTCARFIIDLIATRHQPDLAMLTSVSCSFQSRFVGVIPVSHL